MHMDLFRDDTGGVLYIPDAPPPAVSYARSSLRVSSAGGDDPYQHRLSRIAPGLKETRNHRLLVV